MRKPLIAGIIFLISNICVMQKLHAGTGNPMIQILDGRLNQIHVDSTRTVQDSLFFNPSYNSILNKPYRVLSNVTLKINESSQYYIQSDFSATVRLHITSTLADLSTVSVDTSLTVNFSASNTYTNRNTYHITNAYQVVIKVLSVSTNVGWNVWNVLEVDDQLQSFPSFTFSCTNNAIQTVSNTALPFNTTADELPVSWGSVIQADVYDLEWTYIDTAALAAGFYKTGGVLDPALIFDNSASRVTITGTQYNIPLIYGDSGALFYRVRPVQQPANGLRNEAVWSSNFISTGGLGRFNFAGHQRTMNWQSSISFAEDGKRKVVVQYYDGSLRGRQTVTKDNSTNTTLVAETIYDNQGRPAIQVLPAPTLSTIVAYSQNFNVDALSHQAYDQLSFDTMVDSSYYCTASADSMLVDSGASRYYSVKNPFSDSSYNKFIPDAKGYPFVETSYTPDNTGRVRSQGGVGPMHRITSGHETKYFYGSPDQKEIDALFGTDAGDHLHYFKTMVRDANGQYSVSYADMHGRTVATSLAGQAPAGMDSLKEKKTYTVTETLADSSTAVFKDLVNESKKALLVSIADTFTFNYSLNPKSLQIQDCNHANVCYDCLYDLEIVITDDCNNQKLPGGKAFDTVLHNFTLIDTTCAKPDSAFSFVFKKYLPEGSYDVTKKLSVDRGAMNYYRDSVYTKRNTCTNKATYIQQQKLIQAGVSQCKPACQSCTDSLGTFATFQPRYMLHAGIANSDTANYRSQAYAAYTQAQADCNLLCDSVSEVDNIQNAMLLDMTPPSGQYANLDSANDLLSVFYTAYDPSTGAIDTAAAYTQLTGYLDGDGKLDSVYDETIGQVVPPEQLSPQAFVSKFKLSWAKTLLPYHPEYCKLQKFLTYSASTKWDKRFESTDTYAAALAKGYLNPLGITGTQYTRFNGSSPDLDPLPSIIGGTMLTDFQNELKITSKGVFLAYAGGSGNPIPNIWSLASNPVKYGPKSGYTPNNFTIDSAFSNMCTGDLDNAWRNFREIYLAIKKHITDSVLNVSLSCSGPRTSLKSQTLVATNHQPNFSDAMQSISNYGMYIPTLDVAGANNAKSQAAATAAGSYGLSCAAYAPYWWQKINACGAYNTTDSAAIISQMIIVCQKGSNSSHPMGSSSISPDSTNSNKSFQDVVQNYNTAHGISNIYCNAFGITSPKPYNNQSVYNTQPLYGQPDTCTCNRIRVLFNQYQAKQASYTSFANYLQLVYGTSMNTTDLNSLLSSCYLISAPSCTYSSTPIQLPALLQCNTGDVCVTCEQYKTYNDKFKALYPGVTPLPDSLSTTDTTQITKNQLYAAYMNNQLGFVKSSNDYLVFASTCSGRLAQDSTNLTKDTCNRYTFIKNYGGTTGVENIADVHQTLDGGYILAGSTTSFGNGNGDGYVIKTDIRGNILWSKTYGGALADNFYKIRQTADSGYIAIGNTKSYHQSQGEIFVVKMKANGDVMWSRGLYQGTGAGETGNDIIQTSEKGYAIAGLWNFTAGSDDFEVIKLDSNGNVTWGEKFGSTSSDNLGGIVEKSDTLFMAGFVYSSAVNTIHPPFTYYDALLCKINKATGAIVWAKSYDINSKSNWALGISSTTNGYRMNVLNTDDFSTTNPTQLAFDVDRSGTAIRARQMTVAGTTISAIGSSPTFDGGYIFSQGYYEATVADPFLHKVDASGNVTWTNRIQRTGFQYLTQVFQNADSSFGGGGVDGNRGLLLRTSRWGKTYCSDSALNYPGTLYSPTTYLDTFATTTLTFTSPAITVVGQNAQTIQTDICSYDPCAISGGYGPTLCGRSAPVLPAIALDSITNCSDSTFFAVSTGTEYFNVYRDSLNNNFDSSYRNFCLQAYKYESFTVSHKSTEYHYTLYYYDQAGNLIRTIPPSGVDLSKFGWLQAWSDSVRNYRNTNRVLTPNHYLQTNYRYNTLNQVLTQKTPDAGQSRFWYDQLGRLAISQNLKQKSVSGTETGRRYSYTLYDYIGRITEVGQINNAGSVPMSDSISRSQALLSSWLATSVAGKEQITQTVYDLAYPGFVGINPQPTTQRNLRNRVSYTSFTAGNNAANYNQASFYTYDVSGNVDTLLQDYGASNLTSTVNVMNANNNRWKRMVYQFDLVSGKVNSVAYQANKADQFYHRYTYDAENRIILAESSTDSITWEKEARYQYYKHGPLVRAVIGDQQVQGLDYAYTLHGWLKGVNGSSLATGYDMGRDGDTTWLNRYVARDAYGFNLGYYTGDYATISALSTPFPGYSGLIGSQYKPLYNGNISSMVVNIGKLNNTLLYNYTYDQLNRITGMDVDSGFNQLTNTWNSTPSSISDYKERVAYDPNGNIQQYLRNGYGSALTMDSFTYRYNIDAQGKLLNNRLDHIRDLVNGSDASYGGTYLNDLDNQAFGNYTYDSIGNLIFDVQKGISSITWSVYGKMLTITKGTGTFSYQYDATGNRISKMFANTSGQVTYTWYVRDAQGNVIATYTSSGTGTNDSLYSLALSEQDIYGSSRLGILNRNQDMKATYTAPNFLTFQRGNKNYELSNHLGSVLVTISDKKLGVSSNGTTVVNYLADVKTAMDYYPFGMEMPGRQFNATTYTYSFNGKRDDKDVIYGWQDYGAREYDRRLARFTSVDPLTRKYPWYSPYQFAGNSPIKFIDADGQETLDPGIPIGLTIGVLVIENNLFVTSQFVLNSAKAHGISEPKNQLTRIGRIYEDAVLRSLNLNETKKPIYPYPERPDKYFIPDNISNYTVKTDNTTYEFENAFITEVKYTTKDLVPSYKAQQLKGFIDYLANVRGVKINGVETNEKPSDYGQAALILVTPADVQISDEIINYAKEKNVALLKRVPIAVTPLMGNSDERSAIDNNKIKLSQAIPVMQSKNKMKNSDLYKAQTTVGETGGSNNPGDKVDINWNKD
jgi:RHS repeat-associated protein